MKFIVYINIIFIIISCNNITKEKNQKNYEKQSNKIACEKLERKLIIGDFDGDNKVDTLIQIYFTKNIKNTINEIPKINDYDNLIKYYSKNDIQVILKSNNKTLKPLNLGNCFGTYCFINIGDNNHDNKDEIALVIDYCDYSSLNSCKIYSLCNSNWKLINYFSINENSFTYEKGEKTNPNIIDGFLEKREGKWFYSDALKNLESDDTIIKLKPLKIKNCN